MGFRESWFKKILPPLLVFLFFFIYAFSVNAAPVINRLSPSSGPPGTRVTIYGSGFSINNSVGIQVSTSASQFVDGAISNDGNSLTFVFPAVSCVSCYVFVRSSSGLESNKLFFQKLSQSIGGLTEVGSAQNSVTSTSSSTPVSMCPVGQYYDGHGCVVPATSTSFADMIGSSTTNSMVDVIIPQPSPDISPPTTLRAILQNYWHGVLTIGAGNSGKNICTSSNNPMLECETEFILDKNLVYALTANSTNGMWSINDVRVLDSFGVDVPTQAKDNRLGKCYVREGLSECALNISISQTGNYKILVKAQFLGKVSENTPILQTQNISGILGSLQKKIENIGVQTNGAIGSGCGDGVCGLNESCSTCSRDCGKCSYGVAGPNNATACGYIEGYQNAIVKFFGVKLQFTPPKIKIKPGNLNVSDPIIMKETLNKWVFDNPVLSKEVSLGKFDNAVKRIAREVYDLYGSGRGYEITPCYKSSPAPAAAYAMLSGVKGLCVDWSGLQVSLLRTINVPQERVHMFCYNTSGSVFPQHCTTSYISDSGERWIMDFGRIGTKISNTTWVCKDRENSFWANDADYGWGMSGVPCD